MADTSPCQEGLAWLDAALAVDVPEDARVARARALADKAVLLASVGMPEGVDEAEEALAIARQEDDPTLLVRALLAGDR